MSASKDKGTKAETAVVRYLQANGYPGAERRALAGQKDRGDVAGIPGLVIEVKDCQRMELANWIGEAVLEAAPDLSVPVVWHKRRGLTSPAFWYVSMEGRAFLALLERWSDNDTA